jgi:hypothetical protein
MCQQVPIYPRMPLLPLSIKCLKSTVGIETKDPAYECSIHINLFLGARNARESSLRVRTLWGILTGRKEFLQELFGPHRAQEQTTSLLCKMVIGRISVMCLRGEAVVPRCLVRNGSTGRDGHVWGWSDRAVWCRLRIEG